MPVPALKECKALVAGDRQQINTRRWVLTAQETDQPGKWGGEEGARVLPETEMALVT